MRMADALRLSALQPRVTPSLDRNRLPVAARSLESPLLADALRLSALRAQGQSAPLHARHPSSRRVHKRSACTTRPLNPEPRGVPRVLWAWQPRRRPAPIGSNATPPEPSGRSRHGHGLVRSDSLSSRRRSLMVLGSARDVPAEIRTIPCYTQLWRSGR